jgi:hypothetical protein
VNLALFKRMQDNWPLTFGAALACLALLVLPYTVLALLNRGLDVSDTGHYYVALYYWKDIEMMSSQFPLVWNLLPHPDNIFFNRLLAFVLLAGSAVFVAREAALATFRQSPMPPQHYWILVCAALGGSAVYYYYWLPDPSYNAIGVILMALVLGATLSVARAKNVQGWRFRTMAMLAGFSGLALAATRPVTALMLMAISTALYLLMARHTWSRFWQLLLFAVLGAGLFFVLVQVFIEPINVTLARIQGGLQKREILGIHRLANLSYTYAKDEISTVLHLAPWALLTASVGGALSLQSVACRFSHARRVRLGGAIIGAGGLLWLQGMFWQQSHGLADTDLSLISYYLLNLALAAVLLMLLGALGTVQNTVRVEYLRFAGLLALLLLTTLSFSLFGTGFWITKAALAAVFIVLAAALAALRLANGAGYVWAFAMLSALVLPLLSVRTAMIATPYRLETTLDGQSVPTKIRGGKSTLLTDPVTKTFYDRLSDAASTMGPVGQRPILIDLSGRMPMVQYHLQARPAFTPWLLGTYDGSDAFLETIIGKMSDDELARAWILDAPDYPDRLDPAPILARGYKLEQDYTIAASVFAPYIKTNIVLLAPRQPARAKAE